MSEVIVTLNEPAAQWLDARVASGDWPNASAVLEALVDQERANEARLAALRASVQEGLDSGLSDRTFADILAEARGSLANA